MNQGQCSADNGVYLLKSPKTRKPGAFEYRVIHAQAIDNIYWNERLKDYNRERVNAKILMEYFGDCKPLTLEQAQVMAFKLEKEVLSDEFCPILEYGISTIEIPEPFSYYKKQAK